MSERPAVAAISEGIRDAKDSSGKLPLFEVLRGFGPALMAIARVGEYGHHKHCLPMRARLMDSGVAPDEAARRVPYHSWQYGECDTYMHALTRHLMAVAMGECMDHESGMPHMAHVAWNALAALTLTLQKAE